MLLYSLMIIDTSHVGPGHPQILVILPTAFKMLLYVVDVNFFFGNVVVSADNLVLAF